MQPATKDTLHSLLPTLIGPLPPELLSLASSLLAQSHTRISNLKPTEEIARCYACSHLACERLKSHLDLPPLHPRPPLPARAYASLLSHFRAALPETARRPAHARARAGADESYDRSAVQDIVGFVERIGLPGRVAGYIAAGVRETEHREEERAAVVVVCAMYVIERMGIEGRAVVVAGIPWKRADTAQYAEKRDALVDAYGEAGLKSAHIDAWLKKMDTRAWIEGVPEGCGFSGKRKADEKGGGDRMVRGEVDYLAERRVKGFELWKQRIMERCDEIDAKG